MKIAIGFIIGLSFAAATLPYSKAQTNDPKIVGDSGYLHGLELVDKGYGVVCDTLYYDKEEKQIVCH